MKPLKGFEKRYLRGQAHGLKPVVLVGQKGVTAELIASVEANLNAHELIKVKFVENKEKERKLEGVAAIERETRSVLAGMVGHTAIFYRPNPDPGKRRIRLPSSPADQP